METIHPITPRQSQQLRELGAAFNNAQQALQLYFSAVADGLGLPEGTTLVRVEGDNLVVAEPA